MYDAAGRRTAVTDALGNVTKFGYDAAGNQISMTDAEGRIGGTGSDQAKSLILKELFVYFSLKQCLYRPFWGQKGRYCLYGVCLYGVCLYGVGPQ